MHVDVHERWIDADVDDRHRMPASLQPPLVTLFERVSQRPRRDRPSIDREHDSVPAAAAQLRLRHHAGHQGQADQLEHLGGHRRAVHRSDRAPPVTVARAADRCAAVYGQLEAHVRMQQREGADHILDRGNLGGIRFEELQPRRHVGEEVAHLDRHACQQRAGAVLDHLARADVDACAGAGALDLGDRRDAGQGFAAKPEGGDRLQVGEGGDLACRMTDERKL